MPPHPDRVLPLSGASNFRDLGGYTTRDGRQVRWRQLFRSAHLSTLTTQDQAAVQALGLGCVVDFRGHAERAAAPSVLPGVPMLALPIEPTIVQELNILLERGDALDPEHLAALMEDTYRAFVHDNATAYRSLFAQLLANDAPLLFHCTAGKDRTGYAAALILGALDVPMPVVVEDFLLTNGLYRPSEAMTRHAQAGALSVVWGVQTRFLQAALHAIDQQHGSLDAYLHEVLGVGPAERAELAARYLTQA